MDCSKTQDQSVTFHPTINQHSSVYKHTTLQIINKLHPCYIARNTRLWMLTSNMSTTQPVLCPGAIHCLLLTTGT